MLRKSAAVAFFAAATLLASCADSASTPSEADDVALETALSEIAAAATAADAKGEALEILFNQAVQQIATAQGREAANRAIQPVLAALKACRVAAANGTRDAAVSRCDRARYAKAELVIRVLGRPTADRVVAAAKDKAAALQKRIEGARASGADVTRLLRTYAPMFALVDEAVKALSAGNAALALDRGSLGLAQLERATSNTGTTGRSR
ncbi:MAG: hypothetical protein ACREMQ_21020 [Longimicrobiales bacterium]